MKVDKKQRGSGLFELLIALATIAAVFALVYAIAMAINAFTCEAKWKYSGMVSKYRPMTGCLIRTHNGQWIPEANIREIPVTPMPQPHPQILRKI